MSLIPSIVSWYGGKQKLARQIISLIPEHTKYIEVFCGSGAIFFNKPKVQNNVLNDINSNLVNLFVQVRDNFDQLAEKIYWTLYSREEYKKFYKIHRAGYENIDDLTKALMYSFLVRASFNNMIDLGFSASVESNSANFNQNMIDRMRLAKNKLDSVVIENMDCSELIKKYDTPNTFMYLDPPYWVTAEQRKYYYEKTMSKSQHKKLQQTLSQTKCKWLMSYDDVPEIINLYSADKFHIQRVAVTYSTGMSKKVKRKKESTRKINELLIANYEMKRPQLDIFDEYDTTLSYVEDEEKKLIIPESKEEASIADSSTNKTKQRQKLVQSELFPN